MQTMLLRGPYKHSWLTTLIHWFKRL